MIQSKICVKIDGQHFDSIKAGAESLNCKPYLLYNCYAGGKTTYNGHNLEFTRTDGALFQIKKAKQSRHYTCPVLCTTTGVKYSSISAAAKVANCHNWTMGLKMEKAGKFIDKNGNEYIRERPMNSSRTYPAQTPTVEKEVPFMNRKSNSVVSNTISASTLSNLNSEEVKVLKSITTNLINSNQYNEAKLMIDILVKHS